MIKLLIWAVLGAIGLTVIIVGIVLLYDYLQKSKSSVEIANKKMQAKHKREQNMLMLYKVYLHVPGIKNAVMSTSSMYQQIYVMNENQSRIKAASIFSFEILWSIGCFVGFSIWLRDFLLALAMTYMTAVYFYRASLRSDIKFLDNFIEMIDDMVHYYNAEEKNIDRMLQRLLSTKTYMTPYIRMMNDYLQRAILNPLDKSIITEYNSKAPSRYLSLVFNYLYLTHRYGDRLDDFGQSLFNKNMLAMQTEVHSELMKVRQIRDSIIGEIWFIIISPLVIPAASAYMMKYFTFEGFETISRFLSSSAGQICEVACIAVTVLCYYLYTNLVDTSVLTYSKTVFWEEEFFRTHRSFGAFIEKLMPKKGSNGRKRLEANLVSVDGYNSIRPFYLKKVLMAGSITIIVVLLILIDMYGSYRSVTRDLYRGVSTELMDTVVASQDDAKDFTKKSLSNDLILLDALKERRKEFNQIVITEERQQYVVTLIEELGLDYGAYPEVAAQRVIEKYDVTNKQHPSDIVWMALIVFVAMYMLPNVTLFMKIILNQGDTIYDEVIGYYTVTILLIQHPASNLRMLMEWLTNFSVIFRTKMQACLDCFDREHLVRLQSTVKYKPFQRLIECMLIAESGASLKVAFEGVEQKHKFMSDNRQMLNAKIIKRKVRLSNVLSWGSIGCTFIIFVVVPMGFAIMDMLGAVM